MKPNNTLRAVMDIAVRPKRRPLATSAIRSDASAKRSTFAVQKEPLSPQTDDDLSPDELQKEVPQKPDINPENAIPKPAKGTSWPVGLIVATLVGMATLATLAILVYLKTN